MPQRDYARLMTEKLEARRVELVRKRLAKGDGFVGAEKLKKTPPGTLPKSTKTSTVTSHRPRILCICPKRRAEAKAWYFRIYFDYKEASHQYREGQDGVVFPSGTYRPHTYHVTQH